MPLLCITAVPCCYLLLLFIAAAGRCYLSATTACGCHCCFCAASATNVNCRFLLVALLLPQLLIAAFCQLQQFFVVLTAYRCFVSSLCIAAVCGCLLPLLRCPCLLSLCAVHCSRVSLLCAYHPKSLLLVAAVCYRLVAAAGRCYLSHSGSMLLCEF